MFILGKYFSKIFHKKCAESFLQKNFLRIFIIKIYVLFRNICNRYILEVKTQKIQTKGCMLKAIKF